MPRRSILITGGAGFIGSHLAQRLLDDTVAQIVIFDSLSRPGSAQNLTWLKALDRNSRIRVIVGDVRDRAALNSAAEGINEIYHLAAQVAVTQSIVDPVSDFHINALGTIHVLEAARNAAENPLVFFASTNKVYGEMNDLAVAKVGNRCMPADTSRLTIAETQPIDLRSPYGCSKGVADQYVLDYGHIYGLRTVVFRLSCIAGPRQSGTEDQGWVAHFTNAILENRPVTVFGDGLQVRDILSIYDLVEAISAATRLENASGALYNMGGGLERSISVLELLSHIEQVVGRTAVVKFAPKRSGDQNYYVSDTRKIEVATGWKPTYSREDIVMSIVRFRERGEPTASIG